ncbi:uncharacterized protein LOC102085005 isoform X2 [Columba livia]|uniref:uncharacterized protein LOC102085005 isoform X2 n=1 Tax=Columba livia TaxID=8932 RepID=UPI0031BB08E1
MLLRNSFCGKQADGVKCAGGTGLCWRGDETAGPAHALVSLICLFPFSAGGTLGVLVEIHQDAVNGTVGQSVLLPVSYRFYGAPCFPVAISWSFINSLDKLATCTVQNCSLGAGGAPSSCSANCFPEPTNHSRAELFPENGSLLLRDLQLSDSGVYRVTFGPSPQTRNILLTLHEQLVTPQHPGEDTVEQDYIRYCIIGICSLISILLLLLLFYCIWRRGAAEKQKRRVIKQHQVSSVEESHMDSTAWRDVATIYARIGDRFEQPQPRPTSEPVYASVTSPHAPGLDTRPFHHPV